MKLTPRKMAKDELTKEAIMDVARDIFVSKGYTSASMRKIAQTLKCSHGAIYYHFKNKAELFYEIVDADFKKLDQELDDVLTDPQTTNEEKLYGIIFRFIKFGLTNRNHYEVMFLIQDDEIKWYLQDSPNNSYLKFAQAVASMSARQLAANEIWSLFISMHGFVAHYCRTEVTFEDVESLVSSHVHFLLRAIK